MAKTVTQYLYFQTIRNGASLNEGRIPLRGKKDIYLSNQKGPLLVENYSLPRELIVGQTGKGTFATKLEPGWLGFATSKGISNDVPAGQNRTFEVSMFPADYGVLQFHDLVINFKIGPEKRSRQIEVKRDRIHAAKPFSLMFHSSKEISIFALSTLASAILLMGWVWMLILLKKPLPSSVEELAPEFSLKFINPKHLELAPETLQSRYQEATIVPMTARYYRSIAALMLGQDYAFMGLLPKNSVLQYHNQAASFETRTAETLDAQANLEAEVESNPNWALPIIPSVHGVSYADKLTEAMDLVSKHHRGLELNLKYRRETTRDYRKKYQEYVATAYRDLQTDKKLVEQLEKIKVGVEDKPEDAMYKTAARLSASAERKQKWLKTSLSANDQKYGKFLVTVSPGFKFAALTNLLHPRGDRKFVQIVGAEFGQKQKEKPVYRLTGELPSELIQRVISKRQFELQLCYELALRRNQAANGELEWSWIIDKRGKPQEINLVSSSIQDREMIGCIRNKMASWTFPRPKNGSIRVRYPFRFQPAKG